jgi:hypothetical protein
MNRSHAEMAQKLWGQANAKRDWLATFSTGKNKRSDWEIQVRKEEYDVLKQAAQAYDKAAARDK